jgi:hypothetical protein
MATYIADQETCELIDRYAKQVGKNKTAALRDLLRQQVEKIEWAAGAQERYGKVMERLRPKLEKGPVAPLPNKVFDDMFAYLDEERERLARTRPVMRKRSKKPA